MYKTIYKGISMSKNYWFPHDFNAKDDPKIMLLIDELGMEGFGIYWVLIETLRGFPETKYRYPLKLVPPLAKKYSTNSVKVNTVIKNYGLFKVQNEEFFLSPSLCRRMKAYDHKCKQNSLNAKIGQKKKKLELQELENQLKELSEDDSSKRSLNNCSTVGKLEENKTKEISYITRVKVK